MKKILIFIFLLCAAGIYAQQDTTKTIQKTNIQISSSPDSDAPQKVQTMFIKRLSEGLLKSGKYEVIANRKEGASVTGEEQNAIDAGMTEDDENDITGHASRADYTIYVTIIDFSGAFDVSCSVMQYGSQKLVQSFSVKEKHDIFKAADELSSTLSRSTDLTKVIKTGVICSKCCYDEYTGDPVDCEITFADEKPRTHQEAVDFVLDKGAGWRLPSVAELKNIFGSYRELMKNSDFIPLKKNLDYWTAESYNNYESFAFNFGSFSSFHYSNNIKNVFRCVRPE